MSRNNNYIPRGQVDVLDLTWPFRVWRGHATLDYIYSTQQDKEKYTAQ